MQRASFAQPEEMQVMRAIRCGGLLTFTRGGPPRKMVPLPRTMTLSSAMAGTYAPPAVHEPITTAICGIPFADMRACDPCIGSTPYSLLYVITNDKSHFDPECLNQYLTFLPCNMYCRIMTAKKSNHGGG